MNLAKQPASTIQILGAEKALFRALKTKHETPKYGLLFHASLVGQAPPKFKGKMARVLAAKCALSTRYDALGDAPDAEIGMENRAKVGGLLEQGSDTPGRVFTRLGRKGGTAAGGGEAAAAGGQDTVQQCGCARLQGQPAEVRPHSPGRVCGHRDHQQSLQPCGRRRSHPP